MEYIYVLKLEEDHYYVGKTHDLGRRYLQHMAGEGSKWTQLYKPLSIVATYECLHELDEEMRTLEWMDEKGMDRVRGAGFSQLRLSEDEKLFLTRKIQTMRNRCYRCNQTGHFAQDCPKGGNRDGKEGTAADEVLPLTLEELRARKPCKWLVSRWIPEQSLVCMYGQPGCGKTFLGLSMGLHIAHGMDWHGRKVRGPGLVFYVVAEGVHGIYDRVQAWHEHHGRSMEGVPFFVLEMHRHKLFQRAYSDRFVQMAKAQEAKYGLPTKLLLIDTLAHALSHLNENSSTEVGVLLKEMLYVNAELRASTLFVHHARKSQGQAADLRGSSALLAAVDTSLRVHRESSGEVTMQVEKQKDGEPTARRFHLEKVGASCVLVPME